MTEAARLEAYEFVREALGGATEPVVMRCSDAEGKSYEAVVKFSWLRCSAEDLTRELVGCLLAKRLNLLVGEPALVDVPADLIDALAVVRRELAARIRLSVLPAFGSLLLHPGFVLCRTGDGLDPKLAGSAAEIWAFDQLTLNPDRNPRKPNCLSNGVHIAVIDHEKALNCYGLGGLVPAPWEERWTPYPGHLFHGTVTSRRGNLDRLEAAWRLVSSPAHVDDLLSGVPASWGTTDVCAQLRVYLLELGSKADIAFNNLRKFMP